MCPNRNNPKEFVRASGLRLPEQPQLIAGCRPRGTGLRAGPHSQLPLVVESGPAFITLADLQYFLRFIRTTE